MKTIITLKDTQESREFLHNINFDELKNNNLFAYPSNVDITLRGNFYFSFTGLSYWIEDEDHLFLRIPAELVKDFVIKA